MTNAEKYIEIFGFEPDMSACPTNNCKNCPRSNIRSICRNTNTLNWWEEDYKETNNEQRNEMEERNARGYSL